MLDPLLLTHSSTSGDLSKFTGIKVQRQDRPWYHGSTMVVYHGSYTAEPWFDYYGTTMRHLPCCTFVPRHTKHSSTMVDYHSCTMVVVPRYDYRGSFSTVQPRFTHHLFYLNNSGKGGSHLHAGKISTMTYMHDKE